MYQTILLPTDGSAGAEEATARALDLARVTDTTVHVLSVIETGGPPPGLADADAETYRTQAEARARAATARIAKQAADLGLEGVREIRPGVPHEAIREYATEHDVDLIVMGTHGKTGGDHARLGSTTERVITLGDVPVMSMRLGGDVEALSEGYGMYDHVVIATDGSEEAEQAAEHGLEIAERYGADVHVIYVVDTTTYALEDAPRSIVGLLKEGGQQATETIVSDARDLNLPAEADVLRGQPDEEILDFADGVDADLLVLGTRGRATTSDRLLGSITARVLERAEMPVLTR